MNTDLPPEAKQMTSAMAHEQTALDLLEGVRARRSSSDMDKETITPADLWAYVRRGPQEPSSLLIERALRTRESLAHRYRRMRASLQIASSEQAMAAGTGKFPERQIGAYRLRAVEEEDAVYIVISGPEDEAGFPTALEAEGESDIVRIGLPRPVRGHAQLRATRDDKVMTRLMILLQSSQTSLCLLP